MTTPNEKLADSLKILEELQANGRRVFRSAEFTRIHRERLLQNGFLQEVMKGWVMSSSPGVREGDSTPWYASFWEFCQQYCDSRFGSKWYVGPEQSLLLLAENSVIPNQLVVCSPLGTNNAIQLPFGVSIFDLQISEMPTEKDLIEYHGIRLLSPASALMKVSEAFYTRQTVEIITVLSEISNVTELLRRLLEGNHSVIAGRLAGAFRHIGRGDFADEIRSTMKRAMYDVRESNPFTKELKPRPPQQPVVPKIIRLEVLWESMREEVQTILPSAPGLPDTRDSYLEHLDSSYKHDAYHSLSIEGYQVSPELIERVKAGSWNPDNYETDREIRNALAARGYWQAFQLVREAVERIIAGVRPGPILRATHQGWFRELFQPGVIAGLIIPSDLAGYRDTPVYLRNSRHVPPRSETVPDAMSTLFALLEQETNPAVSAVLGHWLFGYIHPYSDGNGRMARFLMNALLASGGYPWTVIRVEDRDEYLMCLETASVESDIQPFASYVLKRIQEPGFD
ncbi:Fic family protein [Gemmatimonadota bacterium]